MTQTLRRQRRDRARVSHGIAREVAALLEPSHEARRIAILRALRRLGEALGDELHVVGRALFGGAVGAKAVSDRVLARTKAFTRALGDRDPARAQALDAAEIVVVHRRAIARFV